MDEKEILKTFGLNLKIERHKQKISQEQIANLTGFSLAYISNVENAKHKISLTNAYILSKIINKTLDEMLNISEK
ncbi:MAG: hypothetical protein BHW64_00740 [Candidatus Melainabacteria bacterium LEY3_CP_29_8]|nr:MAG: hypothetical protein BHW64_00740 [Candidatus Melainabacteria bacterium LEY3_CP_29_8]